MAKKSKLVLAQPSASRPTKLDFGSGQNPKEGFEGVDLNAPNAQHKVDLFRFPYPFDDNSVDEIHASHFIEHIPLRDVEPRDLAERGATPTVSKDLLGKDMLFAFFDECYRILKPEGTLTLAWPSMRSNRAFQDPTHRRFIPLETLMYLDPKWREANKLDHYRVKCHFQGNGNFSMLTEETAYTPEVQQRRFTHYWNTTIDFHAVMKAIK